MTAPTPAGCGWPEQYCERCDNLIHLHLCYQPGCIRWVDDRDPATGTPVRDDRGDIDHAWCTEHNWVPRAAS